MRMKALLAGLALLALSSPSQAATIGSATFLSDHCTGGCGPQTGGFGTITATDQGNGTIDISIALLNGNKLANGGQDVVFGFNLVGDPTITYSGLNSTLFSIPGVIPVNQQAAGSLSADGFGNVEYGVEGKWNGANGPSSLDFSISGAGLTLASFAQLTSNPPGDAQAFFVLDIFSGTTGKTGFVDVSGPGGTPFDINPVPIPGALWLFGTGMAGLWALQRRRKQNKANVLPEMVAA